MNFALVRRAPEDIERLKPSPYLGVDWEWDTHYAVPTILGLSDGVRTVSVTHNEGWPLFKQLLNRPGIRLVGHNFLQADLQVMESLGVSFPADQVEDTIVWHWLVNPELCKAGGKVLDGDGDKRGRGFMNLFTAMMLAAEVPNWKACVGAEQCLAEGRPCPKHNVFSYNGNDAYWPVKALPALKQKAILRGVDGLYPLHRDVSVVLAKMTERGILIDQEYVQQLEANCEKEKRNYYWAEECRVHGKRPNTTKKGIRISGSFGFNPDSPAQVKKALAATGIIVKNTEEDTLRAALENYPESSLLAGLVDYKELGEGSNRWFAPKQWNNEINEWDGYVDESGYIHPTFSLFTSSGRLASASPNFQNIPVRRGTDIRRAIIAPGGQVIYESDLSNAENRAFLWMAGYYELPSIDLHSWVLSLMGLSEAHPFAVKMGGARAAAKSVQHASNYGEGLVLLEEWQLRKSKLIQDEIRAGARIVFEDWTFNDGGKTYCVSFTGANLAERAFGSKSRENRKLALEVQEKYFSRFPLVRQLQRKITRQIEFDRAVRPPSGLVTASYGNPADRIKSALALWGSQPVAMWTKLAMLQAEQIPMLSLRAQIHDALFFYGDSGLDKSAVKSKIEDAMRVTIPNMEGLFIPCTVKRGPNWAELEKL